MCRVYLQKGTGEKTYIRTRKEEENGKKKQAGQKSIEQKRKIHFYREYNLH